MIWNVLPSPPAEWLEQYPELPATIAGLLWNRNLRQQETIDEFLNPDYSQDLHDPFLFKDMAKAVELIFTAIAGQKNIVVHGDYDADGVCAAAIIISCLKKLGAKNVKVFLPHRETDGYGLNENTARELVKNKTGLLITCDCGISNRQEIELAAQGGVQVIITDHHSIPDQIPPADAIIHPKIADENYPDKGLAGGGVAFKLVQALLKKHKQQNRTLPDGQTHESFEKWLLDLVAIATIGDMVPLLGESRTLARYGLVVLNKTQNLGLKKLLTIAGLADENGRSKRKLDANSVGYQIVPRLNAAGRMDHANGAFALLMADNETQAVELAEQLNRNNQERQKLTDTLFNQAKKQVEQNDQAKTDVLFVIGQDWPAGILGLIAGKIKDCFYKPTIALTDKNGELVGSGRSVEQFNLIAALQEMPEFFSKFGGHPQACGLTLKNKNALPDFMQALRDKVKQTIKDQKLAPQINIDAKVDLEDVNWKLYDLLQKFEPFGMRNEEPKYLAEDLTLVAIEPVGQDGKHLRLMVKHHSHVVRKTIGFGLGDCCRHPADWKNCLRCGDKIDMVFGVSVNEWNGNRELQLTIEDIRKTPTVANEG